MKNEENLLKTVNNKERETGEDRRKPVETPSVLFTFDFAPVCRAANPRGGEGGGREGRSRQRPASPEGGSPYEYDPAWEPRELREGASALRITGSRDSGAFPLSEGDPPLIHPTNLENTTERKFAREAMG